ncbi:hypothetical protein Y032_0112g281 [Ancylostoma ceylanicum]|uniref:Uncharacterized protein n=1 Tax=Ancylostoma ceylanicum TaxID=53326 RepID=A0A016TDP1_9BILA|nr:hypothetical protein Y032_0112g281 [Ancylostoma ceylanicum]
MTEEEKTVTLKLYRGSVPRLMIDYKDKNDLYEKFMKNIRRLNFPIGEIYAFDNETNQLVIKNANDLLAAVNDHYNVKVYVCPAEESDPLSCPKAGKEKDEEKGKEILRKERTPSPARARGRSRSEPRHGSHYRSEHSFYPMPWNFGPWMDPRYGCIPPFFWGPRGFGMDRHHHHVEKKHKKCQCKDLRVNLEKL